MIPPSIPIPLPEGLTVELPQFYRAEQRFNAEEVTDVPAAIAAEFSKFGGIDLSGKTVAVAVGSRGIRSQPPVVRAVVDQLLEAGAKPFLVPAMGSHGGGNAEGQAKILEDYGFSEAVLGIPLRSSMDVVDLGEVPGLDGLHTYCDRAAFEADFLVPINRVKPHTSFRGKWESGLCKMLTIGVGKHKGAVEMHRRGMAVFGDLLPKTAAYILERTRVLFGVAIVENGYERLAHVELVAPADFVERDAILLERAKSLIPRILLPKMDILVVDQIGKDISGAGMDPNVTGRNAGRTNDFGGPEIRQIVVRALTSGTKGNATGMGSADITTQAMVRDLDWTKTYVNLVTAGSPSGAALPLVADTDRDAVFIAMRGCPSVNASNARIVRIENTLDLGTIWVSAPLADQVRAHPDMDLLDETPFDLRFDDEGRMGPLV